MTHTVLMTVHIVAGVAGLLLGPFAIVAALQAGRRTVPALAYQAAVAVITTTAVGFAVLDWRSWWPFVILAVGTEAAVAAGWWARSHRSPGWHARHIRLICGSYISLVTALLVVSWGSLLAWVLPTLVGTVLVERAANRATARPSPAIATNSGVS
ncbi:MAG: hypothetical protein ACR2K0_04335 [Acidimicrobiales bacterium]